MHGYRKSAMKEKIVSKTKGSLKTKVMIKRYTKRNRITECNVGEIVYIFNAESKSRKGKKILGKIPALDTYLLSQVCNERKNCFEDQRKFSKVMIKRYTKRNRITECNVGEIVYIFNAESKSRKEKKILGKTRALEGRIIEKQKNEYKVQYETDDHKLMVDWLPVINVIVGIVQ